MQLKVDECYTKCFLLYICFILGVKSNKYWATHFQWYPLLSSEHWHSHSETEDVAKQQDKHRSATHFSDSEEEEQDESLSEESDAEENEDSEEESEEEVTMKGKRNTSKGSSSRPVASSNPFALLADDD